MFATLLLRLCSLDCLITDHVNVSAYNVVICERIVKKNSDILYSLYSKVEFQKFTKIFELKNNTIISFTRSNFSINIQPFGYFKWLILYVNFIGGGYKGDSSSLVCYNCQKTGHMARDCTSNKSRGGKIAKWAWVDPQFLEPVLKKGKT